LDIFGPYVLPPNQQETHQMKIAQYFFGALCALCFTGLAFTSVLVEHEVVSLLVLHLFYMGSLVSAVALFIVLLAASDSRYR
jgi:ABC-type uncharacterized transport system permease subunit